jgi:hypothetical protein
MMILILRISPGDYTRFLPNLAADGEKRSLNCVSLTPSKYKKGILESN